MGSLYNGKPDNAESELPDSKNNEWRVKRVATTRPDASPWFRPMAMHAIVSQDTSTVHVLYLLWRKVTGNPMISGEKHDLTYP